MARRFAFPLLCAATAAHFVAMGIFLSTLPLYVSRQLHGSRTAVGVAVGSFSIAAVALRPFVGRGLDRVGRRPFLIGGPVTIAVTAIVLPLADAVVLVVVLRLLQGAAGSSFYVSAAAVATDIAPTARRAEYISRFSTFLYLGFATGPGLGEWLVDAASFRWAWLAAAGASAAAAALGSRLPETRPARAPVAAGPRSAALLHRSALGPGLVVMMAAVGYAAITVFSPLYADHIGMGSSGALYLAFAVTTIAVRLFGGHLADRLGKVEVALPGLLAAGGGLALVAVVPEPAAAIAGVGIFSAGFALVFPSLMALTVDRVSEQERGVALGSFTAAFDVGAAASGYAVGAVADAAGFGAAWGMTAGLCGVGAVGLAGMARGMRAEARARAEEAPLPEPAGA